MQEMLVSNLAYDLIFTLLASACLLNRRMLSAMRFRLILPVILCILAILLSFTMRDRVYDVLRLVSEPSPSFDKKLEADTSGQKQYQLRERCMYVMSRFCFCFVNVGAKLFLFKEAAYQKAWSIISEEH